MTAIEKAMNPTAEEAIQYLKGMVFAQDFSPSTLRAVTVNKMCISVITERMEREDGCEYCNLTEPPKDLDVSMKSFVVGDREYIPCDDYFYSFIRRISHCPMCGRKLTQPKEDNNGAN